METPHEEPGCYRTVVEEEVWYSLNTCLIPPDDTATWLDLQRHQPDGVIVMGRFKGVAAAITWAWSQLGVEPTTWYRADEGE